RVLRRLVDPSTVDLRRPPRSEHDLAVAAGNSYVVAYDNLSGLPDWLSDALCSLATGGGFGTRRLYTDAEEELFAAYRPIIINGIDDLLTRPDLTDRSLVFVLPKIEDTARRDEEGFWRELESQHPRILGALLDGASAAMRNLPNVRGGAPRMADFARWVVAAEPGLGWMPGAFAAAYGGNRLESLELALEADPVAVV